MQINIARAGTRTSANADYVAGSGVEEFVIGGVDVNGTMSRARLDAGMSVEVADISVVQMLQIVHAELRAMSLLLRKLIEGGPLTEDHDAIVNGSPGDYVQ